MKKILFSFLLALNTQLFAQEVMPTSFPSGIPGASSGLGFEIIGILVGIFFYVILPLLLYCISSYSLSLLNKHYNKKASSKISWIPFVRYYDFVKQATKSSKKAFIISLFPWIISLIGILGIIIIAISSRGLVLSGAPWTTPTLIIFGVMIALGMAGIMGMSIWRAFIISRHVKGDTTTALGLSTYTSLVLWYIALDRVRKNTNIIGILGFAGIGIVVCFYLGVLMMFGFSGLQTFLGL